MKRLKNQWSDKHWDQNKSRIFGLIHVEDDDDILWAPLTSYLSLKFVCLPVANNDYPVIPSFHSNIIYFFDTFLSKHANIRLFIDLSCCCSLQAYLFVLFVTCPCYLCAERKYSLSCYLGYKILHSTICCLFLLLYLHFPFQHSAITGQFPTFKVSSH